MSLKHSSRWVIVTGAAGSIGKALVHSFTDSGYQVIGIDRLPKPKDVIYHHYLEIDIEKSVIDVAYSERVFGEIAELLDGQGLQVLINNAAVQILGGVEKLDRQDWQTTLNVNLLAPFVWVQALLPHLEHAFGNIINISSIHASLTKKNFMAYSVSKAALSSITRAMAIDLGSRVRVNSISPAAVNTNMLAEGLSNNSNILAALKLCHPTRTIGEPCDVAKAAIFLADPNCPFITGCDLRVDGGISNCLLDVDAVDFGKWSN